MSEPEMVDKTTAIIVLAEALHAATLVGSPAPIVKRLSDYMRASPRTGDVVVEMSTKCRGYDPSRVGTVVSVSRHACFYDRVVEVLMLDAPCGNEECANPKCIHRWRWSNADFVRIPVTRADLAKALGGVDSGAWQPGVDRAGLIGLLEDRGIAVKVGTNENEDTAP